MSRNAQRIREYITRNFYVPASAAFTDDTSLLETGLVDSTGVLELLAFLEQSFDLHVDDEELLPENLDTVRRIVAFVERKQRGPAREACG